MYSLLIVDDEPLTREYVKMNISSIHDRWIVAGEAEDGAEALEFLNGHGADLVITDIKMPVVDGLELCRSISDKYPGQKVIILSGYDEFSYAREAMMYGVSEYLLKPIVKEDLSNALDNIAKKLDREKNNELAYRSLLKLSIDSKGYVVRKFLQSLINESEVEIKTLYPLIYRMKVNLLDGIGMILILKLDEEVLLENNLQISDIPLYKYILNQTAVEMIEEKNLGRVFLDPHENTCVLITGEDVEKVRRSSVIHVEEIYSFMRSNTGLTFTASIGCPVNDILQLNLSYKEADRLLICSLITHRNHVLSDLDNDVMQNRQKVNQFIDAMKHLKAGFIDRNETDYLISMSNLTAIMDFSDIRSVLRCGVYMIKSLLELKTDCTLESAEKSMKLLKNYHDCRTDLSRESIVKLFRDVVVCLSGRNANNDNAANTETSLSEENIAEKAKQYICTHFSEPISLALIADNAGVSPGYLSQLFHKSFGESYIQFLTKVRMEQAAKLLKKYPEERIAQVCEKVGYMGVKHFLYVFKQYFNMTPKEYRMLQDNFEHE